MNPNLKRAIEKAGSIALTGHKHPDGDCVGSCIAAYRVIRKMFPQKTVKLYLETIPDNLRVFEDEAAIDSTFSAPDEPFDLFLILDCSSEDRFPCAADMVKAAKHTFVIDHHMTNTHFADEEVVVADASSTCEVLFDLLDGEELDAETAKALYLGIVHDTGVFKYTACKEHTMTVAGKLLSAGVDAQKIIDDTLYRKSFLQNRLIGYALLHSQLALDGKMIYTKLSLAEMAEFGATPADTEGIIDQLRLTRGIEVALFAREDEKDTYKLSMRAIADVNVASICSTFGGGGHRLAAGCNATGDFDDILTQVSALVMLQL